MKRKLSEMGPRQLANHRWWLCRKWAIELMRRLSFVEPEQSQITNLLYAAYKLGLSDGKKRASK